MVGRECIGMVPTSNYCGLDGPAWLWQWVECCQLGSGVLSHTSELRRLPAGSVVVAAAEHAVKRAGDTIVDRAYFGPQDERLAHISRQEVAKTDVYVAIVGFGMARRCATSRSCPTPSWSFRPPVRAASRRWSSVVFLLDIKRRAGDLFVDPDHGDQQDAFRARLAESR